MSHQFEFAWSISGPLHIVTVFKKGQNKWEIQWKILYFLYSNIPQLQHSYPNGITFLRGHLIKPVKSSFQRGLNLKICLPHPKTHSLRWDECCNFDKINNSFLLFHLLCLHSIKHRKTTRKEQIIYKERGRICWDMSLLLVNHICKHVSSPRKKTSAVFCPCV